MKAIIRLGMCGGDFNMNCTIYSDEGCAPTLWATMGKDPPRIMVDRPHKIIKIATLKTFSLDHMNRVYSIEGISPTISTCGGGNLEPKILIKGKP